jgi:hypothetical protein
MMSTAKASCFLLLSLIVLARNGRAQAKKAGFEDFKKLRNEASVTSVPPRLLPSVTPCSGWEDEIKKQCILAYSEYYRHEAGVFKQQEKVYDFQLLSSKVILLIVILLVLSGIVFAGLQFWYALIKAPLIDSNPPQPVVSPPGTPTDQVGAGIVPPTPKRNVGDTFTSDLEVSMTGFKVKSSILGLLLVLISMVFFFLYIRYVYPIEQEGSPHTVTEKLNTKATETKK